jgi:hypothetical protein
MSQFIVTVRVPPDPSHNPQDKKTGQCGYSKRCTDVTGPHHSFLESAPSESVLRRRIRTRNKLLRITRIEEVGL